MEYSMEYSTEYSMEYENQENGIFQKIRDTCLNSTFLEYGIFQEYSKNWYSTLKKIFVCFLEYGIFHILPSTGFFTIFLEYGIFQEYSKLSSKKRISQHKYYFFWNMENSKNIVSQQTSEKNWNIQEYSKKSKTASGGVKFNQDLYPIKTQNLNLPTLF